MSCDKCFGSAIVAGVAGLFAAGDACWYAAHGAMVPTVGLHILISAACFLVVGLMAPHA